MTEPIKPTHLWLYNERIALVLGTDKTLYKVKGLRRYRITKITPLAEIEQPLDRGWTPEELKKIIRESMTQIRQNQQQLQEQRNSWIKISKEALPFSQPHNTAITAFSKVVKKLGITIEEALKIVKEEMEHDKWFEEYIQTEEFKQDEENAEAFFREMENRQLLGTAFSKIPEEMGITPEEAFTQTMEEQN